MKVNKSAIDALKINKSTIDAMWNDLTVSHKRDYLFGNWKTPTRKKGKWIDTKEISMNSRGQIVHEVICSECNGISYFRGIDDKYIGANLCSNCGAEMEKGER